MFMLYTYILTLPNLRYTSDPTPWQGLNKNHSTSHRNIFAKMIDLIKAWPTCPSPAVRSPKLVIPALAISELSANGFWHLTHKTECRVFKSRFRSRDNSSRLTSRCFTAFWTTRSRSSTSAMTSSRARAKRRHSSKWWRLSSRKHKESLRKMR